MLSPFGVELLQNQKLKALLAKQNTSLKALEKEKAMAAAIPARFEVMFTVLSPAAAPGASDTLWCFVKRWDTPSSGVQSAVEVGGAAGAEDKAVDASGGAGSEDVAHVRTEWQTLGAVLLWSSAVCANKDLVRVFSSS